jgi:hypothetical protein
MTSLPDEDAEDTRIDWLLSEQIGGEGPPDLRQAVLEQLQTERTVPAGRRKASNPHSQRMLAAALLLVGTATVVAVSLLTEPPVVASRQEDEPTYVQWSNAKLVRNRQDIEALPEDTEEVFGINLDDNALPALLRLTHLKGLAMTVSTFEQQNGFPLQPPAAAVMVTDNGIERLATLPNLRALVLEGQLKLKGPGLLRVLENTRLRELNLVHMAITDKLLQGICRSPLLALRLNYSQEFGNDGMKAIGNSKTLRQVSLVGCTHLEDTWIANLSGMPALEMLNLDNIGNHTIFSGLRSSPLPEPAPGSGVTDRLLEQLAPLPKLHHLSVAASGVTDRGLRALKQMGALRELSIGSMSKVTAAGVMALPDSIVSLTLMGHQRLNTDLLRAVLSKPHLQALDLAWCRGMGADAIDQLCEATRLRRLDVSGWQLSNDDKQRLRELRCEVQFAKNGSGR